MHCHSTFIVQGEKKRKEKSKGVGEKKGEKDSGRDEERCRPPLGLWKLGSLNWEPVHPCSFPGRPWGMKGTSSEGGPDEAHKSE